MLLWVVVYVIKFTDHFLHYQNNVLTPTFQYWTTKKKTPNSIINCHLLTFTIWYSTHRDTCTAPSPSLSSKIALFPNTVLHTCK